MKTAVENSTCHEPDPLFVHGYVGWANIPGKGRGAIALREIAEGTVFERCPVVVDEWDKYDQDGLVVADYVYRWGEEKTVNGRPKSDKVVFSIGGHMMLYNHSNQPNAKSSQNLKHNLVEFYALRDIVVGEEITVDYNYPLWFDYEG